MVKSKIKIISNGKLDKVGVKKLGKSFLITLAACAIGFVGSIMGIVDFGSQETIIATMLPFFVNFLKVWLGKYESK